ncbi:hypothetical protein [Flavisolibacter tropicus]|uniref:hypothetical protein n=1 Tax=Flavisolibacter tropicus TaxID=1492898 RepID=UPI0011E04614|nr:hypothetical protein [Flavisolibacter tropicus]
MATELAYTAINLTLNENSTLTPWQSIDQLRIGTMYLRSTDAYRTVLVYPWKHHSIMGNSI